MQKVGNFSVQGLISMKEREAAKEWLGRGFRQLKFRKESSQKRQVNLDDQVNVLR